MIIDPTEFTSNSPIIDKAKQTLFWLLQSSEPKYLKRGIYKLSVDNVLTDVHLKYPLLVRKRETNPAEFRIEVLSREPFITGGHSAVYDSIGVIMPEKNYTFKVKPQDKTRICKIINLTSHSTPDNIRSEVSYSKMNKLLHCKTAIIDTENGYMVMRKQGEMDLATLIAMICDKKYHISEQELLELTIAIIKAFKEQVQDLGLVHNDIKPDNIIVNQRSMTAIIIDYDHASTKETITQPYTEIINDEIKKGIKITGTIPYIAPEGLTHHIRNEQSDLYSLGLTLARLWGDRSTEKIEDNASFSEVAHYHATRQFDHLFEGLPVNPKLWDGVRAVLSGFLNYKPEERMSVKEALTRCTALLQESIKSKTNEGSIPFPQIPDSLFKKEFAKSKAEAKNFIALQKPSAPQSQKRARVEKESLFPNKKSQSSTQRTENNNQRDHDQVVSILSNMNSSLP